MKDAEDNSQKGVTAKLANPLTAYNRTIFLRWCQCVTPNVPMHFYIFSFVQNLFFPELLRSFS